MTKPHEETWDGSIQWGWVLVEGTASLQPLDGERMRLAAQAPAMARLILDIEWSGARHGGEPCCPSCDAMVGEHAPDCELATVLRAAGVLP